MREGKDLIYYTQDIIDTYSSKRKGISEKDISDLLNCAILFLEKTAKNDKHSSIEIPNIGFLHKKLDFSRLEKISSTIKKEENTFIETAYMDIKFSPIIVRELMLSQYYPGITLKELQKIQNDR